MNKIASLVLFSMLGAAQDPKALDVGRLEKWPADLRGVQISGGRATLSSDRWGYLVTPEGPSDAELEATFTIQEPAKQFQFFGQSWSVWPDLTWADHGFEVALLARAENFGQWGKDSGYRVQLSHRLQEVALVKYPNGGYIRSVPCAVKLNEPQKVSLAVRGNTLSVRVDGQEKISYSDDLLPLARGRSGIGASSGAKVSFEHLVQKPLSASPPAPAAPHVPKFSLRKWVGGRPWVFDGDEPILMLVSEEEAYINNVKLRPGLKPLLSFNSYWETSNQGAFPDGAAKPGNATVEGGGKTLSAAWTAKSVKDKFIQRMKMVVGWDAKRSTYTYDVDSELEMLPGEPFHFRYGYDFEHHTPLDPFRWQYLIVRREGGQINHRPVYPIDPGVMDKLEQSGGARVWYGRHQDVFVVAPAVEYNIPEAGRRKMNTAVCAAFYDTGVSFEAETAKPGEKVRVQYRYTGYPAAEAEALFKASTIYETPMLDPNHHYIFADEWPKLTFSKFVPMSETWIYGRRPFMTAHNHRPTYSLEKSCGAGSGFAMKLGPGAYGAADLPIPSPLSKGRYSVTALSKSVNTHGPGGRIEVTTKEKDGKVIRQDTHFVGNGSWDWKKIGFTFEVPKDAALLHVGFGNAGTGDLLLTDVEFARVEGESSLPPASPAPPKTSAPPQGALLDYRMEEGKGLHVFDNAQGPFGLLELANVDWTVDEGRPALRFADPQAGRREFPRAGTIEQGYLKSIKWSGTPIAIAGFHGGGFDIKAFTLSTWVKPAAAMGQAERGQSGDLVGLGARRFILRLLGRQAPYRLEAAFNVNDRFDSTATLEANRWYHVAMTAEPTETKKWRAKVYLDGKKLIEGVTEKLEAPATIPPSLILASEIFYLHDSWYRGLIGRTLLLDHALDERGVAALAN